MLAGVFPALLPSTIRGSIICPDFGGGWTCLVVCATLSTATNLGLQLSVRSAKTHLYFLSLLGNFGASLVHNVCQATEGCLPALSQAQPALNAIQLVLSALVDAFVTRSEKHTTKRKHVLGIFLVVTGVLVLSQSNPNPDPNRTSRP